MVTLGVVIASFLIGPESTTTEILLGVGRDLPVRPGASDSVNAALTVGLKIPSIIATLATLSILSGISLTLRETPGGIIDRDFAGWLGTGLGPVPIAFIVVVVGRRRARLLAPRQRFGSAGALDRVRPAVGQAQRRPHHVGAQPGVDPVGRCSRRSHRSSS